jgi:PDZ domain-containing protein
VKHVVAIAFLLALVAAAPLGGMSSYAVVTPADAYEIGPRLRLPAERQQEMGHMAFTAVYAQPATWPEVARARLFGDAEIVPAVQVQPPGVTQQQVNDTNRHLIDESKPVAAVVGLRAAGFNARIVGQGARVESVLPDTPAAAVHLRAGDVITAVDDQSVGTTTDLIDAVRRHSVGETLDVSYLREGRPRTRLLATAASPSDPTQPLIGVTISTYGFGVQLPFPVDIDSGDVGGSSAGLMFALGVLDAVTRGDLTRGHFIAGTGTIGVDGTVGPVSGAAEKVVAAERDGAEIFLVPRDNYADALRWRTSVTVVPVAHFEDAVAYLCQLEPAAGADVETPAPCPGS